MKKSTAIFLAATLTFFCLAVPVSAVQSQGWYFKNTSDHTQPSVMDGNDYSQYGTLSLGSPDEKVIYLTFDAGYENGNVEKILDILKKQNVPAAFFILPAIIKNNTELVMRMEDEGHIVGNHTYSHKNISNMSKEQLKSDIEKLENVYTEITGRKMSKFFRPPEGSFSEQSLKYLQELGYIPVFWSFAYPDWDNNAQKDPSWAIERIMSTYHPGEIMLLHPTSATNAAILDTVITQLKEAGYRFGSLDELVKSEKENVENNDEHLSNGSINTAKLDYYKEQGMVICENRKAKKYIALTFDDGPHPVLTEKILEILAQYNVKATFFVLGRNVEQYPEIVGKIINAGHEVGNHTYSHCRVTNVSEEKLIEEITATEKLLYENYNYQPKLFRPPAGDVSEKTVETVCAMGYSYVLWAWRLDTRDWASPPVNEVVNTVFKNLSDGDVVLFHDYNDNKSPTPEALKIILPKLIEEGYTFVTVSELASIG